MWISFAHCAPTLTGIDGTEPDVTGRRVAGHPRNQRLASQVTVWLRGEAVVATRKTYVLDTSVLLSDPRALSRFDEHDVV